MFIQRICQLGKEVRFYSCGGDGTIHAIINSIYGYPHVSVAVIPCGTGNDYIKSIGGYQNLTTLLEQGDETMCDLIRVNKHLCLNITSIGLDANITVNSEKYKYIPLVKHQCYNLSVIEGVLGKLGCEISVQLDDGSIVTQNILIAVFAKGRYYGKHYCAAPYANVSDGLMDICLIQKIHRHKLIGLISTYQKGQHAFNPKLAHFVSYQKVKRATIRSKKPFAINLDGETFHACDVSFAVIPKAFRLFSMPFDPSPPMPTGARDHLSVG